MKYIFITGGVCSSLGKGLTAASIGMLLERKGFRIAMLKLDPYLNIDPGTMSPYQHGEVYVTDDGAETDLDLGHYYRYTNSPLSKASNATTGQVYHSVIRRERRGDYLGKTVQVIPHITDEIKHRIYSCAKQDPEIQLVLVEIGGTVGDIESLPFMEAIRQMMNEHNGDTVSIHLTYVPFLRSSGEVKTKPTQHSVQMLRQIGIFPDIIICRCEEHLPQDVKDKISLFCNVKKESVIEEPDVKKSIYEVPVQLHEQGIDTKICKLLSLQDTPIELNDWKQILHTIEHPKGRVKVAVIGKYVQHKDAYKSVFEALTHGALASGYTIEIKPFEAEKILVDGEMDQELLKCDGFLVPGGYGERGWEGKILAAKYAREHQIPFFGICLGMQVMSVEFARNVCGLSSANSTEIDLENKDPVISLLEEQQNIQEMGGTMRLGAFPCTLVPNSKAYQAYGSNQISERHRHRYEFNNQYRQMMEDKGFMISGIYESKNLCEIVEISDHPWMVGVQFHPEFKSKLTDPHPLYREFVKAMISRTKQ